MSLRALATAVLLTLATSGSLAKELYEIHRNVRALGMGNAFVSVVDDDESLFYNPAGLARNGGFFWTVADPYVGVTEGLIDDYEIFRDLQDDSTFESALNQLYGKTIWAGGGGKTAVQLPFVSAALYADADVAVSVNNPVNPTLSLNYVRDTGIALGTGFWVGPMLQTGLVMKRITRVGTRREFGPAVIADILEGTGSTDEIFDNIENKGVGYSLDYGLNMTIPGPVRPTFSFVWKNIGNTKFTPVEDGTAAPPTDQQEWILGSSLMIDLPLVHIVPSIDIKHVDDESVQLGKKIHMGVELGLPLVDVRVGVHQGYLSYGAGLNLGFIRVDAASWGVEVGGYPGQKESRRMAVQASMRIGFDFGIGQGSNGKSGSGASGGSRSFWGGRKSLKQRR